MAKQREKFKTYKAVFDLFTEKNLFKLISQGYFEGIESPISIGKEGNIFSAKKGDKKVIIKIYRLETCDFNRMFDYIRDDPRYHNIKKRRRNVIFAWAQREFRNLFIAREAHVRVPTPFTFMFNILVMEHIGKGHAAPKLKDLYPKNPMKFFKDVISNMKKLYKAGLVHADLSAFNILNDNEKAVFIDFSQATPTSNPNSNGYLERDIRNICKFFRKLDVDSDEKKIKEEILKTK